jgi:hypothetical protein
MRMLAWVNLFAPEGYVNGFLHWSHLVTTPPDWLNGNPVSVILGLVYDYIPYLILTLLASLQGACRPSAALGSEICNNSTKTTTTTTTRTAPAIVSTAMALATAKRLTVWHSTAGRGEQATKTPPRSGRWQPA